MLGLKNPLKLPYSIGMPSLSLERALSFCLLSRCLVISVAVISSFTVGLRTTIGLRIVSEPVAGLFARWDSGLYLLIAEDGYLDPKTVAFRPLYPFLLRFFAFPLDTFTASDNAVALVGFLLSNIFLVIASIYLYKLTALFFDKKLAFASTVFLSFLPGSVFFSAVYAESLFMFLMLAAFYYLEKGTLSISVILAVLAGFTRPEGFLLCIPFLARGLSPPRWSVGLSPTFRAKLGLSGVASGLTLPVFVYFHPTAISVENAWGKVPIFSGVLDYLTIYFWVAAVVTFTSLGMILYALRNRDLLPSGTFKYTLLAGLQLLLFILAVDYHALPRVNTLLLTPLWIAPRIRHSFLLFTLNSGLMIVVTILFVNSYFFFDALVKIENESHSIKIFKGVTGILS